MPNVGRFAQQSSRFALRWLFAPREPVAWAAIRVRLTAMLGTNAGRLTVLAVIVLVLVLVLPWYATSHIARNGVVTYPNAALVNPILTGLGASLLIVVAIWQARTASSRHEAQTRADLERRLTESFSKAVEQLGGEKIETRLGGIYTLERISRESPDDHWTVMETLTAFVRDHARWTEPERSASESAEEFDGPSDRIGGRPRRPMPRRTDIAAVLDVIGRRSEANRERERQAKRHVDLQYVDLRGRIADLAGAHLEGANLTGAHFEGAIMAGAQLEGTVLAAAHLEGALLQGAHLTHLKGAMLWGAHLEHASLKGAHLEGTDLRGAIGLVQDQIGSAYGSATTRLPAGLQRPSHWPPGAEAADATTEDK